MKPETFSTNRQSTDLEISKRNFLHISKEI